MKHLYILYFLFLWISCDNSSNDDPNTVLNESDEFEVCNNIMTDCRNEEVSYCFMGYKWGANNPLTNSGSVEGPMAPGGVVSFSFQEENGLVNTHAQTNLPSRSFSHLADCAKGEMRNALQAWSSVANISFEEQEENSPSDIRFFVADIRQSGIGYPNISHPSCESLKGTLIVQTALWTNDCDTMYKFFLHEIGHVLGMGHVGTENIMSADFDIISKLKGLQSGDIEGMIQLYGAK